MSTLFFLFALNSAGGWNSLFQSGSETVKEFRIKVHCTREIDTLVEIVEVLNSPLLPDLSRVEDHSSIALQLDTKTEDRNTNSF